MSDPEAHQAYLEFVLLANADFVTPDRAEILNDILNSQVRLPHGKFASIAEMIWKENEGSQHLDTELVTAMEQNGIA